MFINNCDNLSEYNKTDLKNLFILINSFKLTMRSSLGLDKNITFGVEIEYGEANFDDISALIEKKFITKISDINTYETWVNKIDDTVIEKVNNFDDISSYILGGEVNSPILRDHEKCWFQLKYICNLLKNNHACINECCGGHVHVGNQIIKSDMQLINFLKLWTIYEKIIYKFCFGENNLGRNLILGFAKPISKDLYEKLDNINKFNSIDDIKESLELSNSRAINFLPKDKNTIEFRCPNGTINPIIWQNNINLFCKMLLACHNINEDIINRRLKDYDSTYNNYFIYKNINLDMALEFCDLIFDNNLDKLYFLKQYMKNIKIDANKDKVNNFIKKPV